MSEADTRIRRLAASQSGVVSRAQLYRAGLSLWAVQRRTRDGVLVPLHGAFVIGGTPVTFSQRCWAAVLGAGRDAALSHGTAGHLYDGDAIPEPAIIDLTIPAERSISRPGVVVHRTTALPARDRARLGRLPVTSPLRTITDLAATVEHRVLEAVVDGALRDRRVTEAGLHRRLADMAARRMAGAAQLRRVVVGRIPGGTHTELERAFVRLLDRAKLPRPQGQAVRRLADGRWARVDFLYPDLGLVVEVDGYASHSTRPQLRRGYRRKRLLLRDGLQVLEFLSDEVFYDPAYVADELAPFLGRPTLAAM